MTKITDTQTTPTETATTELLPLFEEWAALEPDRCIVKHYGDQEVKCFDIELKLDWWIKVVGGTGDRLSFSKTDRAIVQAVVQEAISAHGWSWILKSLGIAEIFDSSNQRIACKYGETPSIAILAAYLQALKAARTAA